MALTLESESSLPLALNDQQQPDLLGNVSRESERLNGARSVSDGVGHGTLTQRNPQRRMHQEECHFANGLVLEVTLHAVVVVLQIWKRS